VNPIPGDTPVLSSAHLTTFLTALALSTPLATAQTWSSSPDIQPARHGLTATTIGDLALFAGGDDDTQRSDVVNIYDSSTATWTTATLSVRRALLGSTSVGGNALFAGGLLSDFTASDDVDIYDAQSDKWTTGALSVGRINPAATSVSKYAFFAGGGAGSNPGTPSDVVDIYDSSTDVWSQTTLSVPRRDLAATTVGPYALFGGGNGLGSYQSVVDVYDSTVGPPSDPSAWSQGFLSEGRAFLVATTAGTKAYFAAGLDSSFQYSAVVDVYDSCIGPPSDAAAWSVEYLSAGRTSMVATSYGDCALFAGGYNAPNIYFSLVDIFDGDAGTWSTESLPVGRSSLAATTVGNQALFGGGFGTAGRYGSVDMRTSTEGHWYVDAKAPGPGDGSSQNPFPAIQTAVDSATAGDQVHVAPGTYSEDTLVIDRDLTIKGTCGREVTRVNDGSGVGRVVLVTSSATVLLQGLSLMGGFMSSDAGGGLKASPGTNVTLDNCVVSGCMAMAWGGGVYADNAMMTLRSTRIEGNLCGSNYVPGVGWMSNTEGGGLFAKNSTVTVIDSEFIGNTAGLSDQSLGGAVGSDPTSVVHIENTLFADNTVTDGGVFRAGGATWGPMTLVGCTLVDNGIWPVFSVPAPAVVVNSIIWDNSGTSLQYTGVTASYSVLLGGAAGPGILNQDPLFRDPLNGDFRLLGLSPAIDAGDNGAVGATVLSDLAGHQRFRNAPRTLDTGVGPGPVVDMGAYEFQPPRPNTAK